MKRIVAFLTAVCLLLVMGAASADIVDGQPVVTLSGGSTSNVNFGDSYYGYCLDKELSAAETGSSYIPAHAQDNIKSNKNGSDVSNYIKIFFVEYFQEIYQTGSTWLNGEYNKDGDGYFKVSENQRSFAADVVWNLTDDFVPSSSDMKNQVIAAADKVKQLANNGLTIPDSGYVKTYEVDSYYGKTELSVEFEFKLFISENSALQDYIGVRAHSVEKPTATATPKPTATATPKPTATETPKPTATETPKPTATEAPKPTATETPKPTATEAPMPTATETPKPTATEAPMPTATATPEPEAIGSVYVKYDKVNVRSEPEIKDGNELTQVGPKNTKVEVLEKTGKDEDGYNWYLIRFEQNGGKVIGYVREDTVSAEPVLEPTATPEPTAAPTPTPEPPEFPQTGDDANLVLWFVMLASSLVGLAAMYFRREKNY